MQFKSPRIYIDKECLNQKVNIQLIAGLIINNSINWLHVKSVLFLNDLIEFRYV